MSSTGTFHERLIRIIDRMFDNFEAKVANQQEQIEKLTNELNDLRNRHKTTTDAGRIMIEKNKEVFDLLIKHGHIEVVKETELNEKAEACAIATDNYRATLL